MGQRALQRNKFNSENSYVANPKKSSDLYSLLGYFRDKTSFIFDGRKYNIIEIGIEFLSL